MDNINITVNGVNIGDISRYIRYIDPPLGCRMWFGAVSAEKR